MLNYQRYLPTAHIKAKSVLILTTTLKKQEIGKYDNTNDINHIDYKNNLPSKILSKFYLPEFKMIIAGFSIKI